MRFEGAPDLRRLDDGRVALGGSPLRFLRLSEKGAALLGRLCAGADVQRSGEIAFARRLADKGMLVPRPGLGAGPFRPGEKTTTFMFRFCRPVRRRRRAEMTVQRAFAIAFTVASTCAPF